MTIIEDDVQETLDLKCGVCDESEDDCLCCDTCSTYPCDCCEECGQPSGDCECCSNCESYPCVCCGECGYTTFTCECCGDCEQYPCQCCSDCESYPCCCEERESFGHSDTPPWEARGIKVNAVSPANDFNGTWDFTPKHIDPISAAADFYLLEAATAGVFTNISGLRPVALDPNADKAFFKMYGIKSDVTRKKFVERRDAAVTERRNADPHYDLQWLLGQALPKLNAHIETILPTLTSYAHMAIGGELRHHIAVGHCKTLSDDRSTAWAGWKIVYEKVGNEALADAAELFLEFEGGGYGGEPWAMCAQVLYEYLEGKLGPNESINKRMFIDRLWTLEHNGGSFLNKVRWGCTNKKQWTVQDASMKRVLDAHASNPPNIVRLLSVASPDVKVYIEELHTKALALAEMRRVEFNPLFGSHLLRKVCGSCNGNPEFGHLRVNCTNFGKEYEPAEMDEDEFNEIMWNSKWSQPDAHIATNDGHVKISNTGALSIYMNVETVANDDYNWHDAQDTFDNAEEFKASTWTFNEIVPATITDDWSRASIGFALHHNGKSIIEFNHTFAPHVSDPYSMTPSDLINFYFTVVKADTPIKGFIDATTGKEIELV